MSEKLAQEIQAIDSIIAGDYDISLAGETELGQKIVQLAEQLKSRSSEEMGRVVKLSIEANETAIFSAQMLYELKQVDEKAQSIAAAGEEMTATVNEIGQYGKNISTQAQEAQEATSTGEQASETVRLKMQEITDSVSATASSVESLNELSKNITVILETIRKIASQTNLLALNATIEAARAGEAGKGFAVVADEVKNLSNQTAEATEQIGQIISQIQTEMQQILESMNKSSEVVSEGEQSIDDLAGKMAQIKQRIDEVTSNTANISETLSQQAIASTEVAQGITTIAKSSAQSVEGIEKIVDAMDAVEKMISAQITILSELNVPGKVVKLAQSDHVIWKKRLANMVAGREGLNADELADHHSCRLGKWYDAVQDSQYTSNPVFQKLVEPHKDVHAHGIEAVRLYNDGNIKDALEEIQQVENASKEVLSLLAQLETVESAANSSVA